MIFRLSDADQAAFLELGGTGEFEPMPGRKMRAYVTMTDPVGRKPDVLAHWMQRSLEFTRSLPPKAKKDASTNKVKKAKQ